jgi:hypothetical protein
MEKAVLAQLKAAIAEQQKADDLLSWGASASAIIVTLRGDEDRVLLLDSKDEDFDAVLAVVQKVASARMQAREAEIDTIITGMTEEVVVP